jgi:putative transposase
MDIAEMMAERGVRVSYETVRERSRKFGAMYAKRMRATSRSVYQRWNQ